jgi:hypothetical protein
MKMKLPMICECSTCGKHIYKRETLSGNTFGARFWTDGKRDAPMLPDRLRLVKCPHCSTLVWIDEQKEVESVITLCIRSEARERFNNVRSPSEPNFTEYTTFLSAGLPDNSKERYVRLRIWWAGNNIRRLGGNSIPMTDIEVANLRAFAALLNEEQDNDKIMKAEALRELGLFEDAEALLATQFDQSLMQAVEIIRSLNQKRISVVTEMTFT